MDTSKTMVLLRENMVFGGLRAPRSSKSDPEDLIWRFLVTSGSNLAVLGGAWEQVGMLMDFMSTPGIPGNPGTWESGGKSLGGWP